MNRFMKVAYQEAEKAFAENEVPVGAVIVKNNEVISQAHNTKLTDNNVCSHAEILALIQATKKIGNWRLLDCEMYITLEPCPMCAGAILNSRIKKIYIGSVSNIRSNRDVLYNILNNKEYNHFVEIEYQLENKCSKILSNFFVNKR